MLMLLLLRFNIVQFPLAGWVAFSASTVDTRILSGPSAQPTAGIETVGAGRRLGGHLEFLGQRQRLWLVVCIGLLIELRLHEILFDELAVLLGFNYNHCSIC